MSYPGKNFRQFLLADANIAAKVGTRVWEDHVAQVPGVETFPFIWLQKRQGLSVDVIDSAAGTEPFDFTFDVECVANDQRQAKILCELLNARCNFYRGAFGSATALGVFVRDQNGDYEPKSVGDDSGLFIESADVRVVLQ